MTKRHSVVAATFVAACIVVAVTAGEQNQGDRFAGVELTAVPVAGNVHMVQGRGGGNVGVFAGPDGVLLVEFLDMTIDVRDQVLSLISEGRTLEQVMAARPTAAYDAQWGQEASWNANDFVPIVFYEIGGRSLFVP